MNRKKYFSVLVKPIDLCNMNCTFCYQKENLYSNCQVMTEETINRIADLFCLDFANTISFQWIGGECLLRGIDFYKYAIQTLDKISSDTTTVKHCIQTNGSLIDESWAEFFRDNNNLSLSISFEIIPSVQNENRPFNDTSLPASYDVVRSNLDLLRYYNVKYGVLSVITSRVLEINAEEWLACVFENGIRSIGLQLCYQDSYWGKDETIRRYINWLRELFIAQNNHNSKVTCPSDCILIRESYYLLNIILVENPLISSCHNTIDKCNDYLLTIDTVGDVYSYCDSFVGLKAESFDFCLGNVKDFSSLSEVFSSNKFKINNELFDTIRNQCADCNYHSVCHGGCPLFKNYTMDSGILIENTHHDEYCVIQRGLLDYCFNFEKRQLIKSIYSYLNDSTVKPCSFFL